MYALVYVDDIIIIRSSSILIRKHIDYFHAIFAFKKLGKSEYFLGIEVKHLPTGCMLFIQTKYIQDLLTRAKMCNANRTTTPMLNTCKLRKHGSSILSYPH